MSRTHRPDNAGIHQTIQGPRRPYGKCPHCKQTKPMHWISRTGYLCYSCMKKAGAQPYHPTLAKKSTAPDVEISPKKHLSQQQPPHALLHSPIQAKTNPQNNRKKQKATLLRKQKGIPLKEPHSQQRSASPGATAETLRAMGTQPTSS